MWSFVDSPSALLAQETTKYPTLPTGSGITQSSWETWHTRVDEGWASYNIARAYHDDFISTNEQRSAENAFKYYEKSAKTGYARAQANLGFCHDIGLVTKIKKPVEAKRWYGEAAKQGNLVGQLNYAQKLLNGGSAQKTGIVLLKRGVVRKSPKAGPRTKRGRLRDWPVLCQDTRRQRGGPWHGTRLANESRESPQSPVCAGLSGRTTGALRYCHRIVQTGQGGRFPCSCIQPWALPGNRTWNSQKYTGSRGRIPFRSKAWSRNVTIRNRITEVQSRQQKKKTTSKSSNGGRWPRKTDRARHGRH